jgi:hypothetical protein
MTCIDEFIPLLNTADTKKKITVGGNIITYLEDAENSLECEDIGRFVDLIAGWLNSSHFKVSFVTPLLYLTPLKEFVSSVRHRIVWSLSRRYAKMAWKYYALWRIE